MAQQIRVNNKLFQSITAVANFLHIKPDTLRKRMTGKKATIHNDLLIEKVDEPVKLITDKPRSKRAPIPVIVDGIAYNSCAEAEKALGIVPCSLALRLRRGGRTFKGHTIEPVMPSQIKLLPRKKREPINRIKVYSPTLNKTFPSIEGAAKVAQVDSWTMSKKMEASGGFIDKNGNEYIRLKPMKTKNTYSDTGKTLAKTHSFAHRTVVKPVDNKPVNTGTPVRVVKEEIPQIVKDAINDKIVQILKDNNIYQQIVDLLNYGGFSTIKIKND